MLFHGQRYLNEIITTKLKQVLMTKKTTPYYTLGIIYYENNTLTNEFVIITLCKLSLTNATPVLLFQTSLYIFKG